MEGRGELLIDTPLKLSFQPHWPKGGLAVFDAACLMGMRLHSTVPAAVGGGYGDCFAWINAKELLAWWDGI